MRANFEPGSFFGEMVSGCQFGAGTIGLTSDREDDEMVLHLTDLCGAPCGRSTCSISLSDDNLDKLQALVQAAQAWRRGEKRDRKAEKSEYYWPGY